MTYDPVPLIKAPSSSGGPNPLTIERFWQMFAPSPAPALTLPQEKRSSSPRTMHLEPFRSWDATCHILKQEQQKETESKALLQMRSRSTVLLYTLVFLLYGAIAAHANTISGTVYCGVSTSDASNTPAPGASVSGTECARFRRAQSISRTVMEGSTRLVGSWARTALRRAQ